MQILLEYQFFPEMFKQVHGSVNEYEDTPACLNTGHFFLGGEGGGGGTLRYMYMYSHISRIIFSGI